MNGKHFTETRIETTGWLPSPEHCRVTRELCNWNNEIDAFIAILRECADGLESPRFSEVWDEHDGDVWPAVVGFRVKTPDDQTEAERLAAVDRRLELAMLARLKAKYESGAS